MLGPVKRSVKRIAKLDNMERASRPFLLERGAGRSSVAARLLKATFERCRVIRV